MAFHLTQNKKPKVLAEFYRAVRDPDLCSLPDLTSLYCPLTFHMLATMASSLRLDTSSTFLSQGLFTCYHSTFLSPLLHSDFCSMSSLFRVSPCHLSKVVHPPVSVLPLLVCFYFWHHLYVSLSIYVCLSIIFHLTIFLFF